MKNLLRLEALALALVLAGALWMLSPPWWLVVLGLALPDLSMIGYLRGPRVGAMAYNSVHSVIAPALLGLSAVYAGSDLWLQIAGIWALHIAVDRALGYGLKHSDSFAHTHLGRIGK